METHLLDSGYAFVITQADMLSKARHFVDGPGVTLLSYEVVPYSYVAGMRCVRCGEPFKDVPLCGTGLAIEIVPHGERLYHARCRPDRPWWHQVLKEDEPGIAGGMQPTLF